MVLAKMLPPGAWEIAEESASSCDVFFSIGTSGVVYPAASLPQIAKMNGAYTVEINIERTELSWFMDEVIIGKSGEVLPKLIEKLKEQNFTKILNRGRNHVREVFSLNSFMLNFSPFNFMYFLSQFSLSLEIP
jgi:thiamine pyrophosphate-dependent acetolactate synthase large subunit-like protein